MNALLVVLQDDAEALHRPTTPIHFGIYSASDLKSMVDVLYNTMIEDGGIGLAANQVGWDHRMFVVHKDLGLPTREVINPKIIKSNKSTVEMEEGCLSYPGQRYLITRPEQIKVQYRTIYNGKISITLNGLASRVFQHENDHLNGITMIDRLSKGDKHERV